MKKNIVTCTIYKGEKVKEVPEEELSFWQSRGWRKLES